MSQQLPKQYGSDMQSFYLPIILVSWHQWVCDSDSHFLTVKLTGQTWLMRMPKKHAFNNMQRAFTHEEIKRSFTRITVDFSPNMTPVISVCLQSLLCSRYK